MSQITSILAYTKVLENLGDRQLACYKALHELGSANNLMISRLLELPINSITGRINELRKLGVVVEDKKDYCLYTGRLSIYWKVAKEI